MWIKTKWGLVNLDKIADVQLMEPDDGTVRVEATEQGGKAFYFLYEGKDREKAEAVIAEVEAALMHEGKLWVLPVQYRE